MRRRWVLVVVSANLMALVALAFIYPHPMVSPGPLIGAHAELATDCFACHSPWRGADSQRCMICHEPANIGVRTTKGLPLPSRGMKTSFHQELIESNCTACHSDHRGPLLTQQTRKTFSHALLRPVIRERCESCHAAPSNDLHRELTVGCAQCHSPEYWKPASFDHARLTKNVLERCEGCHKPPNDSLHAQIKGSCGQCHGSQRWKPATFDHARLFLLDRDHNTDCATCHTGNDYSRYTCYGCHEHTPARVRAEHLEEGIRNFENCVECHRSAREEPKGRGRERD